MSAQLTEISVIGCLLVDAERGKVAFDLLSPEMFEDDWTARVFSACKAIVTQGRRLDIATLEAEIGKEHRQGLVRCVEELPSLAGLEDYCAAILERWRVRMLQRESFSLSQVGTSREWLERVRKLLAQQEGIESGLHCATATDFWGSAMSFFGALVNPSDALFTGLRDFDRVTGGFGRKGFYIIAGRSGLGKTDFALVLALNMSAKYRVSFCSMEMKKESLMTRIASRLSQVDSGRIRDRSLSEGELQRVMEALSMMKERTSLLIDEQLGVSADDLERKILRQAPDVLFVDHIGLMTHPAHKNAWEGVAETSKRLKQLAMKHNIAIVGLAQETRSATGELKGSDNLENDADGIFLMKSEPPKQFLSGSAWIEAEVVIKKLRDGSRGVLKYHWRPQFHEWRQVDGKR